MEAHNQDPGRKPYAPPTLTDLGEAARKTRGFWGEAFEFIGTVYSDMDGPPDDDDDDTGGSGGGNT